MSRHRLWSCFASQRDPEPFRQAMSLRSRGYTTNKKSIGWLFFGRREDVQERRYSYSTYLDIPIKYPAFSPFPLRHLVTSRHNQWWRHSLAHVVVDWDILSEEKTFTTEKYGAMPPPPPPKKEVFVFWRCTTAPFPPPFFGAYVSRTKMLENQSSRSWRKVKTMISLGNNLTILHFWRKLLLTILLLSRLNKKCLSCRVIVIIFFNLKNNCVLKKATKLLCL